MNKGILLATIMALVLILQGCQSQLTRTYVGAASIPDRMYNVTVYNGRMSRAYGVLLDIPDDGVEVFMTNISFAQKVGMNSPGKYIDEFENRIRFYRTIEISDQDDTVRGYLIVSRDLNYWIRPVQEGIAVGIGEKDYPRTNI